MDFFRHSHAALLVELGYSIVAVAERLGDTVKVAMETYSHLYPDKMGTLVEDLERHAKSEGGPVPPSSADDLSGLMNELEKMEKAPEK